MIHAHLKAYATFLDEGNYRVEIADDRSFEANRAFRDGDNLAPSWMRDVWNAQFHQKLSAVGVTVRRGQAVLDVCCGQGFLGGYFDARGAEVIFTDLSLHQLRALADRSESAGMCMCNSDILKLPFPDATFNYIVGNSFLHHLSDVPAALTEMRRVVKPGGSVLLLHEPSISANWWETFPVSLVKDTTYRTGFSDLWQFSASELEALLERACFRKVEIRGSGILAALVCNWYLILAAKCHVNSRLAIAPLLRLRAFLSALELKAASVVSADRFPSLLVKAVK